MGRGAGRGGGHGGEGEKGWGQGGKGGGKGRRGEKGRIGIVKESPVCVPVCPRGVRIEKIMKRERTNISRPNLACVFSRKEQCLYVTYYEPWAERKDVAGLVRAAAGASTDATAMRSPRRRQAVQLVSFFFCFLLVTSCCSFLFCVTLATPEGSSFAHLTDCGAIIQAASGIVQHMRQMT